MNASQSSTSVLGDSMIKQETSTRSEGGNAIAADASLSDSLLEHISDNKRKGKRRPASNRPTTRNNVWGDKKYSVMISAAILSSERKRLPLAGIYYWFMTIMQQIKGGEPEDAGWKNSVRHNLSLYEFFDKVPIEGTQGYEWTVIEEAVEEILWPDIKELVKRTNEICASIHLEKISQMNSTQKVRNKKTADLPTKPQIPPEYNDTVTCWLRTMDHMQNEQIKYSKYIAPTSQQNYPAKPTRTPSPVPNDPQMCASRPAFTRIVSPVSYYACPSMTSNNQFVNQSYAQSHIYVHQNAVSVSHHPTVDEPTRLAYYQPENGWKQTTQPAKAASDKTTKAFVSADTPQRVTERYEKANYVPSRQRRTSNIGREQSTAEIGRNYLTMANNIKMAGQVQLSDNISHTYKSEIDQSNTHKNIELNTERRMDMCDDITVALLVDAFRKESPSAPKQAPETTQHHFNSASSYNSFQSSEDSLCTSREGVTPTERLQISLPNSSSSNKSNGSHTNQMLFRRNASTNNQQTSECVGMQSQNIFCDCFDVNAENDFIHLLNYIGSSGETVGDLENINYLPQTQPLGSRNADTLGNGGFDSEYMMNSGGGVAKNGHKLSMEDIKTETDLNGSVLEYQQVDKSMLGQAIDTSENPFAEQPTQDLSGFLDVTPSGIGSTRDLNWMIQQYQGCGQPYLFPVVNNQTNLSRIDHNSELHPYSLVANSQPKTVLGVPQDEVLHAGHNPFSGRSDERFQSCVVVPNGSIQERGVSKSVALDFQFANDQSQFVVSNSKYSHVNALVGSISEHECSENSHFQEFKKPQVPNAF